MASRPRIPPVSDSLSPVCLCACVCRGGGERGVMSHVRLGHVLVGSCRCHSATATLVPLRDCFCYEIARSARARLKVA